MLSSPKFCSGGQHSAYHHTRVTLVLHVPKNWTWESLQGRWWKDDLEPLCRWKCWPARVVMCGWIPARVVMCGRIPARVVMCGWIPARVVMCGWIPARVVMCGWILAEEGGQDGRGFEYDSILVRVCGSITFAISEFHGQSKGDYHYKPLPD